MTNLTLAVISALKQSARRLKHSGKPAVVEQGQTNNGSRPLMLTLIALSAALMQQTPAPPAPPAPPEVRTRIMLMGADGPGTLDKDGDGQITREEFAAPMNDHFARMDANSDGRLSTEELSAGHVEMAGDDHDIMMMHGPGGPGERHIEIHRVGGGEPGVRVERVVTQTLFVDGEPGADGRREIVIHSGPGGPEGHPGAERRRETWGEWSARRGHQPGGGHGPAGAPPRIELRRADGPGGEPRVMVFAGPEGLAELIGTPGEGGPGQRIEIMRVGGPGGENDLDSDNDGKVSEAEFSAPVREAFARMDADRSGFIEPGERGSGEGTEVFVHRFEMRQNSED